jgi:hypothetical protein
LIHASAVASAASESAAERGDMKRALVLVVWVFWLFYAAPAPAAWCAGIDRHPHQVERNVWYFSVRMRCAPVGTIYFVNSQYNFRRLNSGIEVDYAFNEPGIDFTDERTFYAIAPTLFTAGVELNGWGIEDLNDATFDGLVHATAPLDSVQFQIQADGFVRIR